MITHRHRRLWIVLPSLFLAAGLFSPASAAAATDTDRDGLPNTWERAYSRTSAHNKDTDGDGLGDRYEDPDRDTLPNWKEFQARMNPRRADTDRDGLRDDREDTDRDGLRTAFEFRAGTSSRRADTDRDGLRDGRENPDRDGLSNTNEQKHQTNPRVADTDGDGWKDGAEVNAGTNPRSAASHPRVAPPPTPPPAGSSTVPASIDKTCGTNVSGALNSWIASKPNGSTLVFPSGSCYKLGGDAGLNLKGRDGLTLIGTGSMLQLRTTGASNFSSAFFLQSSTHITIRGFRVDGGNAATGTSGAASNINERMNGAVIRAGSRYVKFDAVSWDRLRGFGILIAAEGGSVWPSDILIQDSKIRGGEMGIAILAARRVQLLRNHIMDSVHIAIDIEPDQANHGFEDLIIKDNQVTRYAWGSLTGWFVAANPADAVVGSTVMNGLTITGNRVHVGPAKANNGNFDGLGGLGIRADKANRKRNVVITNNTTTDNDTQSSSRGVIYLANVQNLTVTGNRQPIAHGAAFVRDSGTSGTRVISGNNVSP